MAVNAFPLSWPDGLERQFGKKPSPFKASLSAALNNVQDSLRRFGTDSGKPLGDIIISSNVTLGAQNPGDPGVAVWFTWEGEQRCIAVDRYPKVQDNLQAIHHIIEARRTELRHGGLTIVKQTFKGFVALPAPSDHWERLGIEPTTDPVKIRAAFREKATAAHPVQGGMNADMQALIQARDAALEYAN
jgi:hypothetical protein